MITVITDADVRRLLDVDDAMQWMREALVAGHRGDLQSPPRVHVDLDPGRLVFTTGAVPGAWFGYRSYDHLDLSPGEQVVVVHDASDGGVRGIAVGNELGPRRVGAVGGVAADVLARRDSRVLGVVGTGTQAWEQVRAIGRVRAIEEVRVHSRSHQHRAAFAVRVRAELGLQARATTGAHETVGGADIVVLATSSSTPVIDPAWLGTGAFVTTVGPKQVGRSEFGPELVEACDAAFTDSVAQISAYNPPNILVGTPQERRLASVGAVLAGDTAGRTREDQRLLFCSVGLAGTEVFLLDKLLAQVRTRSDPEP